MNKTFALIHKGLAFYVGLGVFAQMFFAGVWHAGVVNTPDAHVFLGLSLVLAALLALIAAAAAKLPKPVVRRTALLFFLLLLQPFLIEARRNGLPFVSAFHTLNAPFIGIVSGTVLAMARGAQVEHSAESAISVAAGD